MREQACSCTVRRAEAACWLGGRDEWARALDGMAPNGMIITGRACTATGSRTCLMNAPAPTQRSTRIINCDQSIWRGHKVAVCVCVCEVSFRVCARACVRACVCARAWVNGCCTKRAFEDARLILLRQGGCRRMPESGSGYMHTRRLRRAGRGAFNLFTL